MPCRFLTVTEVLGIHADQIQRYGGSRIIRDALLLSSAVAQPEATFEGRYLHHDLYERAAAYLFHIVKNHPFVDGNKRTGAASALVFLYLNGVRLAVEERLLVEMVSSVAERKCDKSEVAEFFRRYAKG